jgi:hypothetical protein
MYGAVMRDKGIGKKLTACNFLALVQGLNEATNRIWVVSGGIGCVCQGWHGKIDGKKEKAATRLRYFFVQYYLDTV